VSAIDVQALDSINGVRAADWDTLAGESDPFLEHAFLAALEASGSVGGRSRLEAIAQKRVGSIVGHPTLLTPPSAGAVTDPPHQD
jgi:predicted N-acyltransferase